jgi:hypothetical protein
MSNCRPAHGAPGNPCPVCTGTAGRPVYCNQLRGGLSIERARRIIAELAAGKKNPPRAEKPGAPAGQDQDAGRVWLQAGLAHGVGGLGQRELLSVGAG